MDETFINYGNFLFHMETIVSNTKMKFSNYLETLLGSKVKIKILRALFRFETKIFTSRELADQIKVSHTAVLKSLGDLQGMNIIRIESHGNSNLISLNMKSQLFESLKGFYFKESNILQSLKDELRKMLPFAEKIALFGSVASRTEKLNSDIDVLVITNDKEKTNDAVSKNTEKFNRKFGNAISAYVMTSNEFKKKRNTDFVKGILENHIMVKGDEL